MSKKIMKILCLSLTALMLSVLVMGCGGANNSSADKTESSAADTQQAGTTTQEAQVDSNDPVTITMATWYGRGDNTEDDYISRFEKKYPNIKVDYLPIVGGDYSQKLNAMLVAKTAPDLIIAWEHDCSRFAKGKAIVQLDDYIQNTTAFKKDDLLPALTELSNLNGGTYGIPTTVSFECFYYNKNMFDKAGLAYPKNDWTWKDFEEDAKKLTIVKDGKTTQWGCSAISMSQMWFTVIGSTGENIVDSNGKLVLGDGAGKALQWLFDLTKQKIMAPPISQGSESVDMFAAGKVAMSSNGSWMIGSYNSSIKDFKWDIVPPPQEKRQYTTLHTGFYTINADSKVKEAVWKFIEFNMSDEEMLKLTGALTSRKSINEKGLYKLAGDSPTNWAAFDDIFNYGQFGACLANQGVVSNAASTFNAVMMGQMDVDTAIKNVNAESQKVED